MTKTAPPVVSFLVQTGENVQHLHECLYSIVSQSFIDLEVLLLDSGANAETTAFAQNCSREDERIRHLVLPNANSETESLNHGVQQSRGDLIWVLSPSNRLGSSNALKECVTQFLLNSRLGLMFCRVQFMDEHSMAYERYLPSKKNSDMPYHPTLYPGRHFFRKQLKGNIIPESSALVRKTCLLRTGSFQNELKTSSFWQNELRISLDWDVFFDPLPKVMIRKERQAQEQLQDNSSEALEDKLRSYVLLEGYLKEHRYPTTFLHQTQLARLQFMRRNGLKMSLPDRMFRMYRSIILSGLSLNPLKD